MLELKGSKYYTVVTDIGQAKIANSIYSGKKLELTLLKLGDGNGGFYNPESSQIDVKKEVWRGNVVDVEIDVENPNWINIYTVIPPTDGGYYIREMGVFDSDGDMIGICNCAETYKPIISDGSAKEITMKMTLAVVNTSAITLKVDPTVIYAKRKDVLELQTKVNDLAKQMKDIANKVDNIKIADATTAQKGIVQLNNTTNSTSITQAATANAVKLAMDRANEAFTSASNGKTYIAGKVGNVTGSNTFTQIGDRVQIDKNNFATQLKSKKVDANGNEALASLVSKIGNISIEGLGGKKYLSGDYNNILTQNQYFTVDIDFEPSLVIGTVLVSGNPFFLFYSTGKTFFYSETTILAGQKDTSIGRGVLEITVSNNKISFKAISYSKLSNIKWLVI